MATARSLRLSSIHPQRLQRVPYGKPTMLCPCGAEVVYVAWRICRLFVPHATKTKPKRKQESGTSGRRTGTGEVGLIPIWTGWMNCEGFRKGIVPGCTEIFSQVDCG